MLISSKGREKSKICKEREVKLQYRSSKTLANLVDSKTKVATEVFHTRLTWPGSCILSLLSHGVWISTGLV